MIFVVELGAFVRQYLGDDRFSKSFKIKIILDKMDLSCAKLSLSWG